MADTWRHHHPTPADDLNESGLEDAAYIASWALSAAAVLGVVLLIWHFHI